MPFGIKIAVDEEADDAFFTIGSYFKIGKIEVGKIEASTRICLLYTSDAADE